MNKPAQFTPVCTCEIVMRTGETLDSSLGDRPCSDVSRIVLCQFHTAAPAMYEALRGCLRVTEAWRSQAEMSGDEVEIEAATMEITRIKTALAQAEGR